MRTIEKLIIHCTATLPDVPADVILRNFKVLNGWEKPGYHFLIDKHGMIHSHLNVSEVSNGAMGHNQTSINIAYIGGIDVNHNNKDTRTELQKQSLIAVITVLHNCFPNATLIGHGMLIGVKKDCPCFNAQQEYSSIMKPQ
jgi:N-acetylmuramoyl-L-alanine amidase